MKGTKIYAKRLKHFLSVSDKNDKEIVGILRKDARLRKKLREMV
jgi:hypothetical protein